jgi:hypothetical protein
LRESYRLNHCCFPEHRNGTAKRLEAREMTKRQSGDMIFNLTALCVCCVCVCVLCVWCARVRVCVCVTYYRVAHDTYFNSLNPLSPSDVSLLLGTVLLHDCYERAFACRYMKVSCLVQFCNIYDYSLDSWTENFYSIIIK